MSQKLDVLFVHPNAAGKVYQDLSKDLSAIEPPIWAAMLAQHARMKNFTVDILDCEAERFTHDQSAEEIINLSPRLVALVVYGQQPSASTQNMQGASALLSLLKKKGSKAKTILVGLHPSALARQTLEMEDTDFVCQGEGLYTVTGLLSSSSMSEKDDLEKVPGLWYWSEDKVCYTKPAPIVSQKDLSSELPGMAWDLLPMDKYRTSNWHAMSNGNSREPFASIYTSLGCPFKCSFCCINAPFGNNNLENWDYKRNKFRFWEPDFIIEEFEKIHQMGIKNVKIADEMFVMNKSHFLRLCEKIHERGYDFNIWAYARIDTVKEEYLEALKKAGVNWLALGIESGNAVVRKDVIKGKFTEVNIKDLVQKIKDAGINVIGNYIFGLPEDDLQSMRETLDLAKDLQCEFANFYCAMAYPGSSLYLDALRHSRVLPDSYTGYSQHSYDMRPLDTTKISAEEVVRFRDAAFHEYYEDPSYLEFIEKKFGISTRQEIEKMTKHRLKRKILGD